MRSVSSLHCTEDVSDAEEGASESASWCVRACRGQSPEAFLNLAVALHIYQGHYWPAGHQVRAELSSGGMQQWQPVHRSYS